MELYFAFLLFAISTAVTPGPNNIMIMTSGLNYGIKRSVPHYLGIVCGFPLMVVAIGLGLGAVFEQFPQLHEIIKVLGTVYLLYLAWLIGSSSPTSLESDKAKPLSFIQAALFQWVNPKAWVMATGAISAYTVVGSDLLLQILTIALIFWLVGFFSTGVWMVFGVALKRILTSVRYQQVFNVTMAMLLVSSVMPVVYDLYIQYL